MGADRSQNRARTEAEQDRLVRELRESEQKYREIFNATTEAIAVEDTETGVFVDVNEPMVRMYGYASRQELLAASIGDLSECVPPYTQEEAQRRNDLAVAGSPQVFEWIAKRKNGELFNVEVSLTCSPIRGKNRVLAVVRDVTERKKALDALRESEARYRSLFEQAADPIMVVDADTTAIVNFNDAACQTLGYTREEFAALRVSDIEATETAAEVKQRTRQMLSDGGAVFETRHRTKTGALLDVEVRPKVVRLNGRTCIQTISRDITGRKQSEAALHEAHTRLEVKVQERTAKLRALAAELIRAEARERERIVGMLHEDIQQTIVGARFMLGGLRQGRSVEELLAVVDEVGGVLEKANEAMRSLCMDLRPPVLHETGLGAALAWLADEVKRTLAVELEVQSEPAAEPANEEQRTFLYQAAREILLNTFKHAGVKSAQASLRLGEGSVIQLDVKDQGRGFDTTAVPAGGSGLFRLRERAEFFGGELRVRSAPGQGTCVTLTLPRA